jgi:serine/threonine protein kinase
MSIRTGSAKPAARSRPRIPGYTVGKLLGRGASADVYLVVDEKTGARLACKCILKASIQQASGNKMLMREILALKALSHPQVVHLTAVSETDQYYCVIMELCEGGTLEQQIALKKSLDESVCRTIFQQILSALEFCHSKNVAHRDLKPSNILITIFPNIKITDFGLAALSTNQELMSTVCGTIAFLAPEVLQGPYDGLAADIWSSGVLLYTMLTGKLPWRVSNQTQLMTAIRRGPEDILSVSPHCNDLIRSMLSLNPGNRPSSKQILGHPWVSGVPGPNPYGASPAPRSSTAQRPSITTKIPTETPAQAQRKRNTLRLHLSFEFAPT